MRSRGSLVSLFIIVLILLAGLLAGCGGGDQSGNGGQGNGESGGTKKQGGEAAKKGASLPKIALGTVKSVKPERRRVVLKPSTKQQGEKPIRFKISKNTRVTLDNKQAELADIKEGQQAQITYVVRNERNRAREVTLISAGGATPEGGEKTG